MINKYVLYITYDGLLDPLGRSQILPYILRLSKKGFKFKIVSFEKINSDTSDLRKIQHLLSLRNIEWHRLNFKKGKFQKIKRIFRGAILVNSICCKNNINLVHCRTIFSSIIYFFSLANIKFIYDMRSFSGQWVDTRAIKKNSILELILKKMEDYQIKKASGIVVLDQSGKKYLRNNYKNKIICNVIPTSTEINNYKSKKRIQKKSINFVFLGGVSYPYLSYEALFFVMRLIEIGFDCNISFINKGEHKKIKDICEKINFPLERINIKELTHDKIPNELIKYHCGLVFIDKGKWLQMSSPTKIGEYLASGLFVLSLEGLKITDRLAKKYKSIECLRRDFLTNKISNIEAKKLIEKIKNPNVPQLSREVAKQEYSMDKAIKEYEKLYNQILK